MWVAFATIEVNKETTTYEDFYEVCETEKQAKAAYEKTAKKENCFCAGYAPIKHGTEPHWSEK